MGLQAGFSGQSTGAVAIGYGAGATGQRDLSVAVGFTSCVTSQGSGSVAIGPSIDPILPQTIVVHGNGAAFTAPTTGLYLNPINRQSTGGYLLGYDPTTNEVARSATLYATSPSGWLGMNTTAPAYPLHIYNRDLGVAGNALPNPAGSLMNSATLYYNFDNTLNATSGGSQYNLSASGTNPAALTYAAGPTGIYNNAVSLPNNVAGAAVCYAINNTTQTLLMSTINTTGVSVSCWFYLTALPTAGTYPSIWGATFPTQHSEFGCLLDSGIGNVLLARVMLTTGANSDINLGIVPVLNTWYHLVLTIGSGAFTAYLNGRFISQIAFANNARTANSTQFVIGAGGTSFSNSAFPGRIDDWRLFNYPLTASQVAALYTLTNPAPAATASLIGLSADPGTGAVVQANLPATFCRAWVTFTASTAGITILSSFNVSSVTRTSLGVYALTFTTPMSDAGYTFNISTGRDSTATSAIPAAVGMLSGTNLASQLTTGFNFYTAEITPAALVDPAFVSVTVVK